MKTPASSRRYWWLLVIFALLLLVLGVGLTLNPRDVPSPMVSRPAPAFNLPTVANLQKRFSPQDLRGQVWLLNVWASWCVSCRYEHPVLVEFAKTAGVPIVGLNYKELLNDEDAAAALQSTTTTGIQGVQTNASAADQKTLQALQQRAQARAQKWLQQFGDPYTVSVLDLDGRVGIDFGVYGVPESYVIDKAGVIRYKFTGPLDPATIARDITPLLAQLRQES